MIGAKVIYLGELAEVIGVSRCGSRISVKFVSDGTKARNIPIHRVKDALTPATFCQLPHPPQAMQDGERVTKERDCE
ncbi:MAG: hypothetical protein GOVbin4685_49 [Prokaryotic dsDNA virus sp.]|jgi:hypothetical protein|nr:MAG: hypothetical protein GOVbin4685_49 [Prokaryotic dsDNA virus sp.]